MIAPVRVHRVCHVTDVNLETLFFQSIARHHDHEKFPVMIGSIAPAGSLQEGMRSLGTPTFALGASRRWQYPMAITSLAGILQRERISILHAHCFDPTAIGLIAARLAGVPFVFARHHSDHHIRLGKKWHTRVDGWCARWADAVLPVSEATRRIMIEIEGVPANRLTLVYNGMEPLREPTTAHIEKLRRELDLGRRPILLMLARLHEEKGHRFLFDALPQIAACVGSVRVLLAGDGPHRNLLEAEVRERGLENTVRFLGRRRDVPELLGLASMLVVPSLAESFGFVLVEAMSLGKPVVATAVGGIPEVIVDGQTGLLVPAKNAPALAQAVCRVLKEQGLATRLGIGGRVHARKFTFERMIRSYEKVYQEVLCI